MISQNYSNLENNKSKKIDFELIADLIVIPLKINDTQLSFVLDSGVNKAILFNLSGKDSLPIRNARTIYLQGLGADGKIEALKSSYNTFKIGEVTSINKDLYVLVDNAVNFTPRLGVLVHGIVGYDVFKDFVVEINYSSKYIRLHNPETFKPKTSKKWKTLPIDIINNKPFVNASAKIQPDAKTEEDIMLLIDTGSSDALWLFENEKKGLQPNPDMMFKDFLGKGLSGEVYGLRSKVKNLRLSDFKLNNVNVAYPDSSALDVAKIIKGRSGSVGGGVLKRFNVFFDYQNEKLHLKKNSRFKAPFTYNNSGIILEHNGIQYVKEAIKIDKTNGYTKSDGINTIQINTSVNYQMKPKPIYIIAEIRKSSNAYKVGLQVGDVVTKLNGILAYDKKLSEINHVFHGQKGKTIRLTVKRKGEELFFKFDLDDAFKKETLPN